MAAVQLGRFRDALDMAEAARACTVGRRDPLRASLTHARIADAQARAGDRKAALRSMGHAWAALDRGDASAPRPAWLAFFDAAELSGLAGAVRLRLGDGEHAEACTHRTLSVLRPEFERNRVYYTVLLARTQAAQGEAELACATAATVLVDGTPLRGRIRKNLTTFHAELTAANRGSRTVRDWDARRREYLPLPEEPS